MTRLGLAAACLLSLVAAEGCGYRLSGSAVFLPDHIRVIALTAFENRTTRTEIEQRVTEEISNEFTRRGRYRVATDRNGADALLEGAVLSYRTTPVQFTSEGRATRLEASVSIEATLRDLSSDQVLWSQSGLLFREQFDVPEGGEFTDLEQEAMDDLARGVAGALVNSILEGF